MLNILTSKTFIFENTYIPLHYKIHMLKRPTLKNTNTKTKPPKNPKTNRLIYTVHAYPSIHIKMHAYIYKFPKKLRNERKSSFCKYTL